MFPKIKWLLASKIRDWKNQKMGIIANQVEDLYSIPDYCYAVDCTSLDFNIYRNQWEKIKEQIEKSNLQYIKNYDFALDSVKDFVEFDGIYVSSLREKDVIRGRNIRIANCVLRMTKRSGIFIHEETESLEITNSQFDEKTSCSYFIRTQPNLKYFKSDMFGLIVGEPIKLEYYEGLYHIMEILPYQREKDKTWDREIGNLTSTESLSIEKGKLLIPQFRDRLDIKTVDLYPHLELEIVPKLIIFKSRKSKFEKNIRLKRACIDIDVTELQKRSRRDQY